MRNRKFTRRPSNNQMPQMQAQYNLRVELGADPVLSVAVDARVVVAVLPQHSPKDWI